MNSARTTPTADSVRALMPQLQQELAELVAIPCVSASGYPEETHADLLKARDLIVDLLRDAGVGADRVARAAGNRSDHHGRDPGARRRADGAPLRPLRRRPGGRGVEVGVAPVRGDRARRCDLRPRRRRLEVEHPRARRRPPRLGRPAARGHQARDRGPGGDRQRVHDLPAVEAGAVRRRRDGDRGHGQPAARRADADDRAARHGERDRRGADARGPEAQRPVRRRRPRRARRPAARPREPARRARRRRRRRASPGGVDRRHLQRRRVPRAGGGRGRAAVLRDRRSRRAGLVRACAHRHRRRRPARRPGAERRRPLRPGASSTCGFIPSRIPPRRRRRSSGISRRSDRSGSRSR